MHGSAGYTVEMDSGATDQKAVFAGIVISGIILQGDTRTHCIYMSNCVYILHRSVSAAGIRFDFTLGTMCRCLLNTGLTFTCRCMYVYSLHISI